jgi:DNA-binding response OmpR family regulator
MIARHSQEPKKASGNITTPQVILVVEHDHCLRESISSELRTMGYFVLAVSDGTLALEVVCDNPLSLIFLDLVDLQPSGIDFCRQLRSCSHAQQVSIFMMVTHEDEITQIERWIGGVDDYIKKPINWEELRACVLTLLRHNKRSGKPRPVKAARAEIKTSDESKQIFMIDDLCIDVAKRTLTRNDQIIQPGSAILFDLLVYLVRHRGVALTRKQLMADVWGYDNASVDANNGRTVSVHIHWLREFLGDDPDNPQLIQTVRGIGYRFKD